ncbi:hypothetical protein BJ684DRAFT_21510 [Piptocephalis cylindrospora]|uniref:Uncharacterized protein n=1 Tax=Piptocephalis cylindrospora TaxID=1907219 RepID=A0A4P9XZJ1_9FUNG|nr:hypothetical protein BJ684DRAFT_21510 [Piptocephalis cylindrospora]|eukprot:RKP11916.1 hypothetical protein BJ684DRAFT_21510 [Piptocephalis cylindrospora]
MHLPTLRTTSMLVVLVFMTSQAMSLPVFTPAGDTPTDHSRPSEDQDPSLLDKTASALGQTRATLKDAASDARESLSSLPKPTISFKSDADSRRKGENAPLGTSIKTPEEGENAPLDSSDILPGDVREGELLMSLDDSGPDEDVESLFSDNDVSGGNSTHPAFFSDSGDSSSGELSDVTTELPDDDAFPSHGKGSEPPGSLKGAKPFRVVIPSSDDESLESFPEDSQKPSSNSPLENARGKDATPREEPKSRQVTLKAEDVPREHKE